MYCLNCDGIPPASDEVQRDLDPFDATQIAPGLAAIPLTPTPWDDLPDGQHAVDPEGTVWQRRSGLWHRALLRDPDVYLPVRLRDGDGCRYCARIVIWKDGKSARGGTLDHVIPDGQDLVVACKGCNSKKQARSLDEAGMTLLPVPTEPHYSAHTRSVFARYGITSPRPGSQPDPALLDPRPGSQPDPASPRPATQADPAPRDPATSRTTPRDPAQPDTAPSTTKHRPSTDEPHAARPDQDLPGRVGSGSGLGRVPPAPQVGIPALTGCAIELHYAPRDSRHRDAINLCATLKPIEDGIVDAGVVPGDDGRYVEPTMPILDEPTGRPCLDCHHGTHHLTACPETRRRETRR